MKTMRATWLADVLRDAGLTVVEVRGWQSHGSSVWAPYGGIVHATADGAARNAVQEVADDAAAIRVIRDGRPGLPGPIANIYHARDGRAHIIASGRCNTALPGTAGTLRGIGNTGLLGIEHESDNRGEKWTEVQYDSAIRMWAAICKKMGWTAARLSGHKEHDPGRKSDPMGIDMKRFRADVAKLIVSKAPTVIPGAKAPTTKGDTVTDVNVWDDDIITNPADRDDAKTNKTVTTRFALENGWHNSRQGKALAEKCLAVSLANGVKMDAMLKMMDGEAGDLLERLDAKLAERDGRLLEAVGQRVEAAVAESLDEAERDAVVAAVKAALSEVADNFKSAVSGGGTPEVPAPVNV